MSYLQLSKSFMAEARRAIDEYKKTKDETALRQACEKGFGAFAQVLMFYKGRELHHREFREAIEEIYLKTKNYDITLAHRLAEALHSAFYNGALTLSEVEDSLNKIELGIQAITELK